MSEWFQNYRASRLWVGLIVVFLASMVQSCSELKHSIWGKTVTANVMQTAPSIYKKDAVSITLHFKDEQGADHLVKRTVNRKLGTFENGQQVQMIYLPAVPEKARLIAERSFVWPFIFFGMIGVVVIWSFVTYRRMEAGKF